MLSNEQVAALTKQVELRVEEFGESYLRPPSQGMVRIVLDELGKLLPNPNDDPTYDVRLKWWEEGYEHGRLSERDEWERRAQPSLDALQEIVRRHQEREQPGANGNGVHHEDLAELAKQWPVMPDLTGGVDRFAEHPVAGEPAPKVDEEITHEVTPAPNHPWKNRVDGKPSNPLPPPPDPDVARERVADMLAKGSNGDLVAVLNKPRTLAEVDEIDDDADDDDFDDEPKPKQKMTDARRQQLDKLKRKRKMGYEQAATGKRGNVLPTLQDIVAELQRLSLGTGVMPSIATFDAARPGNWATAGAHMQRLGLSWAQLAHEAGLQLRPSRHMQEA